MPTHWQVRAIYHDPKIIDPRDAIASVRVDPIDPNGEILRGGRVLGDVREDFGIFTWVDGEAGISGREETVERAMASLIESLDRGGRMRIPGGQDEDSE